MRQIVMLTMLLFCFCLTGCSAAAYFLSGCGDADADLVVVNWDGRLKQQKVSPLPGI